MFVRCCSKKPTFLAQKKRQRFTQVDRIAEPFPILSRAIDFRIVRKIFEFMKISSLLISIPGLKCTVKRSKLWKLIAYKTPK